MSRGAGSQTSLPGVSTGSTRGSRVPVRVAGGPERLDRRGVATVPRVDVAKLLEGIRSQKRSAISQAITLVESSKPEHRAAARDLLTELAQDPRAGVRAPAVRVGISGVPGVGKSTFIEAL